MSVLVRTNAYTSDDIVPDTMWGCLYVYTDALRLIYRLVTDAQLITVSIDLQLLILVNSPAPTVPDTDIKREERTTTRHLMNRGLAPPRRSE